jgi:FkbM family methyltransferase
MLLRKSLSFLRLFRQSSDPLGDLKKRLRENWFAISHGTNGKPFRYETAPGFPFTCVPASASSRFIRIHGYQEQLEATAAARWLRNGDACVDVGANVGYFACLFASKAGRDGKVIALEPSPRTFAFLTQTVRLLELPQVALENVCALDADRPVRFMESTSETGDCEQSLRVDESQRDQFHEVEVNGTTLDALVRKHHAEGRVSIVKIDVEGAEPLVLKGSSTLFDAASLPFFFVEIHQLALANFQFTARDILASFPDEEFRRFIIPRSTSDATPERPYGIARAFSDADELPVLCNLLALPRAGKFASRAAALAGLLPGLTP